MKIIIPLTKSPWSGGRIGREEDQDWFKGLMLAKELLDEGDRIAVISALQVAGAESETEIYLKALKRLGVLDEQIMVIREGYETIGQVEVLKRLSLENGASLAIISTFLHYPRVRWLCRGLSASHEIAFGLPRPKEALTDILLALTFPILDILGFRGVFERLVTVRRLNGDF